jgi:hypothetical protein
MTMTLQGKVPVGRAAADAGVSERTLYNLRSRGLLVFYKHLGRVYCDPAEVAAALAPVVVRKAKAPA